jgi:nucleoside-diphosphate-sugar epimerase
VKSILVTGATGFIGQPLVRTLVNAGYPVRVAVRRNIPFPDPVEVRTVPDFRNPVDWAPVLDGINVVIHSAGLAHADRSDLPYGNFDRINRVATDQLARAAATAGIERLIYISSVRAQVGPSADHLVTETRYTETYGSLWSFKARRRTSY